VKKWIAEISNHQTEIHSQWVYADTEARAVEEMKSLGWTVWSVAPYSPADPELLSAVSRLIERIESLTRSNAAVVRQLEDIESRIRPKQSSKTICKGVFWGVLWAGFAIWLLWAAVKIGATALELEAKKQNEQEQRQPFQPR
jgi:hypothetical protein